MCLKIRKQNEYPNNCVLTTQLGILCKRLPLLLGKPLFQMCWFYMGIAQIALDPPPLCQMGKHGKKVPQPSWQVLTPLGSVGKKCPKLSWQAFTLPYGQYPYENNTFQKGASLTSIFSCWGIYKTLKS